MREAGLRQQTRSVRNGVHRSAMSQKCVWPIFLLNGSVGGPLPVSGSGSQPAQLIQRPGESANAGLTGGIGRKIAG